MYSDEFDTFVYQDAIERCGLSVRNACARVDQYNSWIQHAIVRLGCAACAAEFRATEQELEQDIRIIETRLGWSGELMKAYRKRSNEALTQAPSEPAAFATAPTHTSRFGLALPS